MHRGFTLAELIVVVVIIGILASIALPRFSSGAEYADLTTLRANLHMVRNAIELYTVEHLGRTPNLKDNKDKDDDPESFIERLVGCTLQDGTRDEDGKYGPYLRQFPRNRFIAKESKQADLRFDGDPPGAEKAGWHFDTTTGKFSADSAGHESE